MSVCICWKFLTNFVWSCYERSLSRIWNKHNKFFQVTFELWESACKSLAAVLDKILGRFVPPVARELDDKASGHLWSKCFYVSFELWKSASVSELHCGQDLKLFWALWRLFCSRPMAKLPSQCTFMAPELRNIVCLKCNDLPNNYRGMAWAWFGGKKEESETEEWMIRASTNAICTSHRHPHPPTTTRHLHPTTWVRPA